AGQYAVVGSTGRATNNAAHMNKTLIGEALNPLDVNLDDVATNWLHPHDAITTSLTSGDSYQGNATFRDGAGAPNAPYDGVGSKIRPVVGIPCSQIDDASVLNSTLRVGLNISEPLHDAADPMSWYLNKVTLSGAAMLNPTTYGDADMTVVDDLFPNAVDTPFDQGKLVAESPADVFDTETKNNYKNVFLQRLADPTLPWHPTTNPYLSVDWMPIDLTVFNTGGDLDAANAGAAVDLASRERGNGAMNKPNIWGGQAGMDPNGGSVAAPKHTLGYLNRSYHSANPAIPEPYFSSTPSPANPDGSLLGLATGPSPWLAWNNRPYVSGLELMQVPASSPSRLYLEFGGLDARGFYDERPKSENNPHKLASPFGHL
ncbi:MAG: hypothetical protein N2C14_12715, partial [Planctomycetales bacterium]